jgi:hypothetical protein
MGHQSRGRQGGEGAANPALLRTGKGHGLAHPRTHRQGQRHPPVKP